MTSKKSSRRRRRRLKSHERGDDRHDKSRALENKLRRTMQEQEQEQGQPGVVPVHKPKPQPKSRKTPPPHLTYPLHLQRIPREIKEPSDDQQDHP